MKHIIIAILLVTGQLLFAQHGHQCTNASFEKKIESYLDNTVNTISVKEAAKYKDQYLFLDAREMSEYTVSHIPESRFIGYDNFNLESIKDISTDTPIVIYCSIGYRSEKIGEKLQKAGYTNVFNLYGSIFEWANQGQAIVDIKNDTTSNIHTYNKKWSKWVINENLNKIW